MRNQINLSFKARNKEKLHNDIIFKNYQTKKITNPWFSGLANTFVNSKDFFENSDKKLFRLFKNPRALADFDLKFVDRSEKVFPRKPLECGWIDYPNLKFPDKTTGVGLRRIHRLKSNCPTRKKPFRLESIPEAEKTVNIINSIEGISLYNSFDKYKAGMPRWVGARPDIIPIKNDPNLKSKIRQSTKKLDSWIKIPYSSTFYNNVKEFEINNYLVHELMKFNKTYLSEGEYANSRYALLHTFHLEKKDCTCKNCQKATKARTIIDATTNWLGFTNTKTGHSKLAEIITMFTGNNQFMEYHHIEEPSKNIIIRQYPLSMPVNVGINGEKVSHKIEDFTIISEIKLDKPFEIDPEYSKLGREVVDVFPKCSDYKPLSWDEQLSIPNVKILYGTGRNIQRPNEINKPMAVANKEEAFNSKKFLPRNPDVSDRSILEIKDWFSFCKLTRSLIRSTPHFTQLVDESPMINKGLSDSVAIYDGVIRDCLENTEKKENYKA